MRSMGWLIPLAALLSCHHSAKAPPSGPVPISTSPGSGPAQYVNTFVGTANAHVGVAVDNGGSGATFPGPSLPFGMVQWSPDTPNAAPPGYQYDSNQILGFSVTHLNGAGCPTMRDFPVLPLLGDFDPHTDPSVGYKHENELASPGFYEVSLDNGVKVDLTATTRTGLARFTFPASPNARLVISGGIQAWDFVSVKGFTIQVAGPDTITGTRSSDFCGSFAPTTVYYVAKFDRPFTSTATWGTETAGGLDPDTKSIGEFPGGATVTFDATTNAVVHMKIGLSYVSLENAQANLDAENPGWDFNAVHQAALDRWNGYLDRIHVDGGTDTQKQSFYTALYHVLLQPNTFSDVNGDFTGFDGMVHHAPGRTRYANFSGWDVYRSWIQLVSLIAPDEASEMVQSLIDSGVECGALPKWAFGHDESGVMVGDPADAIIANAWAFGAQKFDTEVALSMMLKGATDPTAKCHRWEARPDLVDYLHLNYCPADPIDSVWGPPAATLEYTVADFALAQFAKARNEPDVAATFLARAQNWKNLFNPALEARGFKGYIQSRYTQDMNGQPNFRPADVSSPSGFVEGNPTQYSFFVPHDVAGLISAMGGDAAFIPRLDDFFTQLNAGMDAPYAYIGNEPGFNTPWLYPFAGAPWRTQDVVRRAVNELFTPTPDGLPGNDDLGSTSSWLVWGMLGLYPEIPGVGGFVLASPIFPKAELTLAGGKKLTLIGHNASATTPYVQSLTVNGEASTSTWLPMETVAPGATLEFTLGAQPNQEWGSGMQDRPPSFY